MAKIAKNDRLDVLIILAKDELFLGSMLPQYMGLCVRYVSFVTSKKKFLIEGVLGSKNLFSES